MAEHFEIVRWVFLACFVVVNWVGPRYFGLAGMVVGHLIVLFGYFWLAGLAIEAGRFKYDGPLTILGLAVQAFLLNCAMLPITGVAFWRRKRVGSG